MSLTPQKERDKKERSIRPIPIWNTIHKYFIELLLFIIIIVVLILYKGSYSNEIILTLIGGLTGRLTSK